MYELKTAQVGAGHTGGMNIRFPRNFSSLLIFDGVHFHPTVSYGRGQHLFSLVLVRSRDVGFSYSVTF